MFLGKESKNGIKIGNDIITRLSGPISTYFLRPRADRPVEFFPLVLLFGDRHFSKDNSCFNCICEDNNDCCLSISSLKFLQMIDSLALPEYPIDFYTEMFLQITDGFKGGYMHDLINDYPSCFYQSLKNTIDDNCPTKNIRWQGADARQAGLWNFTAVFFKMGHLK